MSRVSREHRSAARVAVPKMRIDLPSAANAEPSVATTVGVLAGDVSMGGVGFSLERGTPPVAVGDRVMVRFALPDTYDELIVRAEVRHVELEPGGVVKVGAKFLDADELIQNPLYRFVEESLLAVRATTEMYFDGLAAL